MVLEIALKSLNGRPFDETSESLKTTSVLERLWQSLGEDVENVLDIRAEVIK
jgi:hypothetical protein